MFWWKKCLQFRETVTSLRTCCESNVNLRQESLDWQSFQTLWVRAIVIHRKWRSPAGINVEYSCFGANVCEFNRSAFHTVVCQPDENRFICFMSETKSIGSYVSADSACWTFLWHYFTKANSYEAGDQWIPIVTCTKSHRYEYKMPRHSPKVEKGCEKATATVSSVPKWSGVC